MNREQTLQEALKCVTKDRQSTYGTPESNFSCIADLWSTYLGVPVTARQVAVMMILLKISRTKSSPGYEDNYVDIAGYAACAAEISQKSSEPATEISTAVSEDALKKLFKPGDTDLQQSLLRDPTQGAIGDVSKGAKVTC